MNLIIAWFASNHVAANLLMAQCVRYDLGNVFDPAYTMVCKLNKQWLPSPA